MALELLQGSPGISAERLSDKLGVSERAARRYVAILREAGIPIESIRGPYGGYRVGRGLRLPPLTFSSAEALGLVMAVLDGHHEANDPSDPVSSALSKIMRALPEPVAAQAEVVRRTTAPAPDASAARPDPNITTLLVTACSEHRLVRLDYRSESGREWTTDVEPWGVVVRHGRWYLVCRSVDREALRAYRVDRVRAVDLLPEAFRPPADLDPVALLQEHLATGWEYAAEVIIYAPIDEVCLPGAIGRLEPIDDGTCRLIGSTSNPQFYAEQLAMITAPCRVVGGPELRASVKAVGERLLHAAADVP